jgi:hypothetical protein
MSTSTGWFKIEAVLHFGGWRCTSRGSTSSCSWLWIAAVIGDRGIGGRTATFHERRILVPSEWLRALSLPSVLGCRRPLYYPRISHTRSEGGFVCAFSSHRSAGPISFCSATKNDEYLRILNDYLTTTWRGTSVCVAFPGNTVLRSTHPREP